MSEEYGVLSEESMSVLLGEEEMEIARLREEYGELYDGGWYYDE